MNEIEALSAIDKALTGLKEDDARKRVLHWAVAKFGGGEVAVSKETTKEPEKGQAATLNSLLSLSSNRHEIPGIALISDNGDFRLTVRDPKATSANDAAVRLALVAIYAYCELTGENSVSSRKIVVPTLTTWRAYTGNTRATLAKHQGIIRSGDALSLDQHARREAEKYIREILDEGVEGSWQPSGVSKRRGTGNAKSTESK
jgi:hypothetical protein